MNHSFWSNPILYNAEKKNRSIILISVDTLRADHLGSYGYQCKTSPNIDFLASEGVTFLNTYASSPWTLPSHVSLLTSLHGVHHQVYYDDDSMDPSLVTLGDILSHLGGKAGIFQKLTDEERQNVIGLYDGEIRYVDDKLIGPLINRLKEIKIYEQTLIIFTSDHGEEFFDHQGWGHGHSVYDELLKVPLIIKFPDSMFKNQKIFDFVSLVDVFPTILEQTGVSFPNLNTDGQSLFSLIRGEEKGDRSFLADIANNVLDSHMPRKIAMNKGKEKLILNQKSRKEDVEFFLSHPPFVDSVELYDLSHDSRELKNIADKRSSLANQIIKKINNIYRDAQKINTKKIEIEEELKRQWKALGYIR